MAIFIVSYDLNAPGQDYQPLYDRLAQWKAVRGLESVWFINWDTTTKAIRDDLKGYVDDNDRLFVGKITSGAWQKMMNSSGPTVKGWLEA